jgi:thiamine-phosphate pyrophosphorylase
MKANKRRQGQKPASLSLVLTKCHERVSVPVFTIMTDPRLSGLHVITIEDPARGRTHVDVARAALIGGASVIQLREKNATTRELLDLAVAIRDLCHQAHAIFLVNDRLDVALASSADGVHLGQDDLPIADARRIAGSDFIIGISAGTVEEARHAADAGADYLGIGPVYFTATKEDAGAALGLALVTGVRAATNIPIIGIGGINSENARTVINAGAHGLAVITAISSAPDMVEATRNLVECMSSEFRVQS